MSAAATVALTLHPIGLREANDFVNKVHRHHRSTWGHKFSVCVRDEAGQLRGVAIAGRPVARGLDDGHHIEVTRLATDGTPNACSMLYAAVARAAVAMGYPRHQVLTYTLLEETGESLRAAGWWQDHTTRGGGWDMPGRRRVDKAPTGPKRRWRAARPPVPTPTEEADHG